MWLFPKNGGKGRDTAPAKIFYEPDFYTNHLPGGQRDLKLEHYLDKLEDKFCKIRDSRIADREPLKQAEKESFCAFIASTRFRTRAQRDAFRQQWGHAHRVLEDVQQALDEMTPEQHQQYRPPISLSKTSGPSLTINDVQRLADQPMQHMLPTIIQKDLTLLTRMNLVFFTTADDIGFVTSDNPCVWCDPQPGRRPLELRSPTIEVTMPVSPNSLALLCWEDLPKYVDMPQCGLEDANALQQGNCNEYFVVQRNKTNPV